MHVTPYKLYSKENIKNSVHYAQQYSGYTVQYSTVHTQHFYIFINLADIFIKERHLNETGHNTVYKSLPKGLSVAACWCWDLISNTVRSKTLCHAVIGK